MTGAGGAGVGWCNLGWGLVAVAGFGWAVAGGWGLGVGGWRLRGGGLGPTHGKAGGGWVWT